MESLHLPRRTLLAATASLVAPALAAGRARILRYRATLDLVTLDTVATISTPAFEAAFLIYDCLFGLDAALTPRPQMVDRYETEPDGLTWRFALRDGLRFHDDEPVRAHDAIASIARWASRDRVGLVLKARTTEMRALDDRRFEIRLRRPFPRMLTALATTNLFVMPARVASHTDPATPVIDHIGSGPFIFEPSEWVSGVRATFRRNPNYQPRPEAPSLLAGGKVAHLDRVEWSVIPDTATATAALLNDEIDLIHVAAPDVLPLLRRNKGIVIERLNHFGNLGILALDTVIPPLDNPALRRAMLLAIDQEACMRAVVGEETDLMRTGVGMFAPDTPLANQAGLEALAGPRDVAHLRRAVQESGYAGERIAFMIPTDTPTLRAFGEVIYQSLREGGLNMDYQAMDWGTLVSRRNQVKSGIWHTLISVNPGQYSTPGTHYFVSSVAYDDPAMNTLRDAWYDAPDGEAERRAAEQVQRRFFENPPALPLGQYYSPSAYRATLRDLVPAPWAIFWNASKS